MVGPAAGFSVILFTFVASALHRYLLIVHNKKPKIFSTKWQAMLVLVTWALCFGIACFGVFNTQPHLKGYRDFCYMQGETTTLLITSFVILNVVPILVVPLLYLRIYFVVRRATVRVASNNGAEKSRATSRKHTRMALVLFLTYIAFTVTFLPFLVYSGMSVDESKIHLIRYTEGVVWMFVYVGVAANPIVYACLFVDIAKAFKEAFRFHRRDEVMTLDESFGSS